MKIFWVVLGLFILIAGVYYIFNAPKPTTMATNQNVTVTPIEHASLGLTIAGTKIIADPVGDPSLFSSLGTPDIVLVTHIHPDHLSTSTLLAIVGSSTALVVPQSVADQLPPELKKNLTVLKNGDTATIHDISIEAIPAYNVRPDAQQFHPKSRGDNGYVLSSTEAGKRIYIAGDTEGTPEMKALTDIDIAFVPMNLPYTMSVEDAADAVLAFKPKQVYPYHYRGPNGLSDVAKFKQLVNASSSSIEVVQENWYAH